MSYTYATYTTALANLLGVGSTDADFVEIEPSVIDYAEQRIYRELNLLATTVRDSTSALTPSSRSFTLPSSSGRFVTVEAVNVITPAGVSVSSGTRNPLVRMSRKMADFLGPVESASVGQVPVGFAMITDQTIVVTPAPGSAFVVEVVGTIRPTPLSASTTTTFLTLYLPDLFMAASMIFGAGWQKNFGSQSDDVRSAQSWEAQYQSLVKSANAEEIRRRFNQTLAGEAVPA